MDNFIFKGKSSEEFKIIVNSLPSISKPTLRVEEIEIDGVDGTRYEELGYGSYDKKIKITITEDNIDSLIGWLKGEGDLILSNEPDKYYKAKIINQINFSRLMKYEPTEITFRVQPFKYEYQEEEQITATGSTEGTNIKITDAKATQLQVDGRSTQETRSSKNKLKFSSNRQPGFSESTGGLTFTINEDYSIIVNGTNNGENSYIYILIGETLSLPAGTYIGGLYNDDFHLMSYDGTNAYSFNNVTTLSSDITLLDTYIEINSDSKGKTFNNVVLKPIIVSGDSLPIEWESYGDSPSPEKPSEINSVGTYNEETGKYGVEVKTIGKNSIDKNSVTSGYRLGGDGTPFAESGYWLSDYIKVKSSSKYVYSRKGVGGSQAYAFYDKDKNFISRSFMANSTKIDISTTGTTKYIRITELNDSLDVAQLEEGSNATEYQGYKSNKSVIVLDAPLRSLPNGVKDIAYIKNNKLYVDRYVGSADLGSFSWKYNSSYGFQASITGAKLPANNNTKPNAMCDVYGVYTPNNCYGLNGNITSGISIHTGSAVVVKESNYTDVDTFTTAMNGYFLNYELATPVTEEYGDLTILELLDGGNNISNSADTNMVIDYVDNKMIINNIGNYVSKPIFEIEGYGTIKFILNDYSVFTYNFDEDGRVVIDSEKEDAYLDEVLKNRNMNGEFPKLELGENIVTWDGLVKNMKVVKKSRWL